MHEWSLRDLATLRSLWIRSLPPLPQDPSNAVGDDPRAAQFGHRLFFDTRFSSNGEVACVTCHQPERVFTDGLALGKGVGTSGKNTMSIVGAAYSPWYFWDGRKDSQWSQALGPMESRVEHGGTRMQYAHLISSDSQYRELYQEIFGPLPDLSGESRFPASAGPVDDPELHAAWLAMRPEDRDAVTEIYANMGKAIAAYERLLLPGRSRFDWYVETLMQEDLRRAAIVLSDDEVAGLRLFIGQAQCLRCHNGPLFANHTFHNTGTPDLSGQWLEDGRESGVHEAKRDLFNCLGPYSDADEEECTELRFAKETDPHFKRAFKTPTLRNIGLTAPYMHAGQFRTLSQILAHYNTAPTPPVGMSELVPLNLNTIQLRQLEAFLLTLDSAVAAPPAFLLPPDSSTQSTTH